MSYGIKRIADPVHGTIGLSQPEVDLLSTRAFQRLRNIKHLGLAHFVFPGADYSRLSHGLGVCHVTGRILDSLRSASETTIDPTEYQHYRLAGLLHDVGHFPFSHAFQDAVSDYYKDHRAGPSLLAPVTSEGQQDPAQVSDEYPPDHEGVGQLLLEHDSEIKHTLQSHEISPNDISSIFAREKPPRFANLISSDLDADRIDYLLRTAHHTGLPYGSVDIEYILSQLQLDNHDRICLTSKALHTAEHFLLSRYFDYQQINYHKTVAAFEELLKDIVVILLKKGKIDCSRSGILEMVQHEKWYHFDDSYILQKIQELKQNRVGNVIDVKVDSLLRRVPPKLIGSIEFIDDRNQGRDLHSRNIRDLQRVSDKLSEEFNIPRELWYVWDPKGSSLTKIGSSVPVSMLPADEDDLEQAIRIKDGKESKPIVNVTRSLMTIIAQKALYTTRLYLLFPDGRESERSKITEAVRAELSLDDWIDGK